MAPPREPPTGRRRSGRSPGVTSDSQLADADLRQQRKLAYYRVLTQEDPAFGPSVAALCQRFDAILAPFDRNAVRWELLDAIHGGAPADQIPAFRAIVADCERQASETTGQESIRWREQAELPRRFADVVDAAEHERARWRLPADGTVDLIDAYLRGEDRLVPSEPATLSEPAASHGPPRVIRLEPPPLSLFLYAPASAGGSESVVPAAWAIPYDPASPAAWTMPYNPAPPAADDRDDLEARLARLFAFLRDQALEQAAHLEASLRDQPQTTSMESEAASPLMAPALMMQAWLLFRALHQPGGEAMGAGARDATAQAETVQAWAADLGITLP
jgi:hypothetical protein